MKRIKPVKDGGMGEVVVTTLGVEGMPLLRYRTGDLCAVLFLLVHVEESHQDWVL